MQNTIVLFFYIGVAAILTAYTFYHGVLGAPRVQIFTFADQALLTLATLAVGVMWPLFIPALAVLAARHLGRNMQIRPGAWMIHRVQHLRP